MVDPQGGNLLIWVAEAGAAQRDNGAAGGGGGERPHAVDELGVAAVTHRARREGEVSAVERNPEAQLARRDARRRAIERLTAGYRVDAHAVTSKGAARNRRVEIHPVEAQAAREHLVRVRVGARVGMGLQVRVRVRSMPPSPCVSTVFPPDVPPPLGESPKMEGSR